jgi:hypothetical protein
VQHIHTDTKINSKKSKKLKTELETKADDESTTNNETKKTTKKSKKLKVDDTDMKIDNENQDILPTKEKPKLIKKNSNLTLTHVAPDEINKLSNRPVDGTVILSWNVNGLRAALKSGAEQYLKTCNVDIICLSEIKMDEDTVKQFDSEQFMDGYYKYWNSCTTTKGYAGTA